MLAVGVMAVFWTIWKARNVGTFCHIYPSDPTMSVFRLIHWITYWAGLQIKEKRQELQDVALLLIRVAT